MKLDVGQIIFIVAKKKQQVLPARVVEEIQKRTMQGEETLYSVEIPIAGKLKTAPLSELGCEVFSSVDDAKNFLMSNASSVIDELLNKAESLASENFRPVIPATPDVSRKNLKVKLENGAMANVKMPEGM